jgi:hypothetical protein
MKRQKRSRGLKIHPSKDSPCNLVPTAPAVGLFIPFRSSERAKEKTRLLEDTNAAHDLSDLIEQLLKEWIQKHA